MEWLKDKKNLPIVIGIAVFVLLGSGGLMAFELGLFGGGAPTPIAPALVGRGGPSPTAGADNAPALVPPRPMVASHPPTAASAKKTGDGKKTAAATPAKSTVVDPTKGPDPFSIPGGQKRMASLLAGEGIKGVYGMKAPLRDILPPFDLFKPQEAAPPPALPSGTPGAGDLRPLASKPLVSGIVTGVDGISAILEVNGESQTVKPGDSLLDGSKVISIQTTTVTIRSADGTTTDIPLTGGSGGTDPTQAGPNAYGNGGQPQPFPNNPNN